MVYLHSCCWGKSQLYPINPLVVGQDLAENPLTLDLGHPIAENRCYGWKSKDISEFSD